MQTDSLDRHNTQLPEIIIEKNLTIDLSHTAKKIAAHLKALKWKVFFFYLVPTIEVWSLYDAPFYLL